MNLCELRFDDKIALSRGADSAQKVQINVKLVTLVLIENTVLLLMKWFQGIEKGFLKVVKPPNVEIVNGRPA